MQDDTQLLKGVLEGCTLKLLSEEATWGYKIVELLREYGFHDIQEATVYPLLTRLYNKGMLKAIMRPSGLGPMRKYYELSGQGKKALELFIRNWEVLKYNVDKIIQEEHI